MSAETPAAAQALADGRSELHQSLSSLGVSLLRLDIGSFGQSEARDREGRFAGASGGSSAPASIAGRRSGRDRTTLGEPADSGVPAGLEAARSWTCSPEPRTKGRTAMTTPAITAQAASATGASPASAGATTPENPNGVLGQNDFLKLMIAQLQAQNPLEPGNSNEYLNELAQFTQVEQMTNLANANELSGAVQLIGHTVSYNGASGAPGDGDRPERPVRRLRHDRDRRRRRAA